MNSEVALQTVISQHIQLQNEMKKQEKLLAALEGIVEKEKKEKDKFKECSICYERVEKLVGFLHGDTVHVCACDVCSKKVEKCPICNLKFQNVVKVF